MSTTETEESDPVSEPSARRPAADVESALVGHGTRRQWWVSFLLLFALAGAWALATPIFASPDEPAHVVRALSVARGELLGDPAKRAPEGPDPIKGSVEVDAPLLYSDWGNAGCMAFRSSRTAACLDLDGPTRDGTVVTTSGYHPPGYYLVVGVVGRLWTPGEGQVLLMRLVSAALVAALLASALATLLALRRSANAVVGFAIALTPMVLFLAGSVNPNSIEIAAGASVWVNGTVLAAFGSAAGRRVIDRLGLAACVLCLSRSLSPLWLLVIVACLLPIAVRPIGGRATLWGLVRVRRLQGWAAAVGASAASTVAWILWAGALDGDHFSTSGFEGSPSVVVRASIGKGLDELRQMIGVFGWLDTFAPSAVYVIWIAALGALVGLMLVGARRSFLVAAGLALAATVVLPRILEARQAGEVGLVWYGRYSLPLAVGLALVIGIATALDPLPFPRARRAVILVPLAAAQALAFWQALRRYAVGADGTLWFWTRQRWAPPLPSLVLIAAFIALLGALTWWLLAAGRDTTTEPARSPSPT